MQINGKMVGVECKRTDAPKMTPSIRIALDDLELESVIVIYPGQKQFPIAEGVEAFPLCNVSKGGLFGGVMA